MSISGTWQDQENYTWYTQAVLSLLSRTKYAPLVSSVIEANRAGGVPAAREVVRTSDLPRYARDVFYTALEPRLAKYDHPMPIGIVKEAVLGCGYVGGKLSYTSNTIAIEDGVPVSIRSLQEGPFGLLDQHLRNLRLGLYCEKTGKGRDSLSFSIDDVRVFQSRPGAGSWKIFVNTRDMTVTATPGLESSDLVAAIETTYASEFSRAFDYVGEFGGGYPKGLHTLEDAWKVCQAMGVQNVTKKSLTTSLGEMPVSDIKLQQVSDEVDRKDGFGPRKVYKFGCEMQGVTPSSVLQHVLVLVKVFGRKLKVAL